MVGGRDGLHYRFTIITDGLLRYEWAPDGVFEDRPSAFAAKRNSTGAVPDWRLEESDGTLDIVTSRFRLTYDRKEFTPHGLFAVVSGHTRRTWRYGQDDENLGGTARTLDGVDGRMPLEQGVVSQSGFATIDDSTTMLFEDDGSIAPRRPGSGRVDGYLFAYGHDYRDAVKALYSISGPTPVLPRWALGNWWSRYYEYTADSYLELMDEFLAHKIPLSVAVLDMDWHLVNDPRIVEAGMSGWTGYTWNKKLFPNPPAFLKELRKRGLRTTLNDHPADGVHSYEDLYSEFAKAVGHDPSDKQPIPFNVTDKRYRDAYFSVLINSLEEDGCDFIWIDWQQGEFSLKGIDPLWVLNHYHFVHNAKKHPGRPMIFSRYAGPGSHRYPVGFSGDTIVSWESLNFQPEFTNTASNIGYGWWSHDIGGHQRGIKDDELTTRWVQYGVFSPIMRLHSTKNRWVAKEAWKLSSGPREIVTDFMQLRHRLIPYLHTLNIRASQQGEPLIQPMYWGYPRRQEAYKVPNQYFFGTEMIVMPITTPQDRALKLGKVKGWLPPGRYIDYFTGMVYAGDRELWISRPLHQYPVFLKEGSIVPLDGDYIPRNGAKNPRSFEILVVVGADGAFDIVEDEEDTDGSEGSLRTTPIKYTQATGTIEIGPERGHGAGGGLRSCFFHFLGVITSTSVVVRVGDGQEKRLEAKREAGGFVVQIGEVPADEAITVGLGWNPQLAPNRPLPLIESTIQSAQIAYGLKDAIWNAVTAGGPDDIAAKLGRLQAVDMDDNIRFAITELLLADGR